MTRILANGSDILISQIDKVLARVKLYVAQQHPEITSHWKLDFHVYGKGQFPGQLFIVAEALASTQQLANIIASRARVGMIASLLLSLLLFDWAQLTVIACSIPRTESYSRQFRVWNWRFDGT